MTSIGPARPEDPSEWVESVPVDDVPPIPEPYPPLTRYTLPQHEVDTYVRAVDPNRGIAARIKRWRQRRREHWPRITPPTVPPKAPPTFTNDD